MRHFLILLRVQLLALINSLSPVRSGNKVRKASTRIILTLAAVFLLTGIAVIYMLGLGIGLVEAGLADAIPVFAVLLGSLAGVVFTFLKANGTLFGMADYDLVMSLPFPRRTVVASRMAALFCSATLLGAVFMVPLYAVYFAHEGVTALGLLTAVLSMPLAPAAPTGIAAFASFALTAVAARFRHANLVYIAFVLITLTAFVVGSYGFSFSLQAGARNDAAATLATIGSMAGMLQDGIARVYPPAGMVARAITADDLSSLAAFTLLSLIVLGLCLEIMQRNYLAINGLLAGGRGRGHGNTEAALAASERTSSPFKALVIKELRTQIGIPTYAINCLFGYLLMLVLAVALAMVGARGLLESGALNTAGLDPNSLAFKMSIDQIFLLVPWAIAFCAVVSPSAATAISLEGKSAWLMATAPVSTRTILGAKLASNAIPMAVAIAASAAILLAGGQIDAFGAVETVVIGFGLFYCMVNLGMLLDARHPNLTWSNAQEVVKRGLPTMVCAIGGIVLVFGLGGTTMALAFNVSSTAAHAFGLAVGVIGLIVGQLLFMHACKRTTFFL